MLIFTLVTLQFSKKDAGIYEVILKDDRGKDRSELKLLDAGQNCILNGLLMTSWVISTLRDSALIFW